MKGPQGSTRAVAAARPGRRPFLGPHRCGISLASAKPTQGTRQAPAYVTAPADPACSSTRAHPAMRSPNSSVHSPLQLACWSVRPIPAAGPICSRGWHSSGQYTAGSVPVRPGMAGQSKRSAR